MKRHVPPRPQCWTQPARRSSVQCGSSIWGQGTASSSSSLWPTKPASNTSTAFINLYYESKTGRTDRIQHFIHVTTLKKKDLIGNTGRRAVRIHPVVHGSSSRTMVPWSGARRHFMVSCILWVCLRVKKKWSQTSESRWNCSLSAFQSSQTRLWFCWRNLSCFVITWDCICCLPVGLRFEVEQK